MPRDAQHVLVIRGDQLSRYGPPRLHTPHLDARAAKGVLFT
jgi:hypothetical protein